MNKYIKKLFYISLLCLCAPSFSYAYQFTNNLVVGISNNDVIELQKILNSDAQTRISESGPGSPGNETNYFGNLTKQAVIRFQEKYRNEILTPKNLSFGTGFVGGATREKLNKLNSSAVPVQNIQKTTVSEPKNTNSSFNEMNPIEKKDIKAYFGGILSKISIPSLSSLKSMLKKEELETFPQFTKSVRVYNVLPYQAKPGQNIVINGAGFTESDNIFIFNGVRTAGIKCEFATYCTVSLPNNVSLGENKVYLENYNGKSANQGYDVKIMITNSPANPPLIYSINPTSINASDLGQNIVVTGDSFTFTQNSIDSPLGQIGVYSSSDNKTITFLIKDVKDINKMIEKAKSLKVETVPFPFRVSNEYGSSDAFFINIIINK